MLNLSELANNTENMGYILFIPSNKVCLSLCWFSWKACPLYNFLQRIL